MHLTNNAVQKNSKNYGSVFEGNIASLQEMGNYFNGKLNINKMIKKDLVEIASDHDDKRKKIIRLSKKGNDLIKQMKPIWNVIFALTMSKT